MDFHTDEITDCVEVLIPICIATCSKDKTIVLYDLKARTKLRTISDQHETWINKVRYQPQSAYLVSLGNEAEANVWAPESLVSKIHIGKLSGHKHAIIDG